MAPKTPDDEATAIARSAGVEPIAPYPGQNKPWRCQCLTCGEEVTPRLKHMSTGRRGCKYCAGNAVPERVRLREMAEANLEPLEPYPGKDKPWKMRCLTCGRKTNLLYGKFRMRGTACVYCNKKRVVPAEAVEIMRAANLEPLVDYPGSTVPWLCRCQKCEREVSPKFTHVQAGNSSCAYCAGNRLTQDDAIAMMLSADLEPLETYRSKDTPWLCRCLKCGQEVRPRYSTIRKGVGGCRFCADHGYNYALEAQLYVLTHKDMRAVKIGVAKNNTSSTTRVEQHQRFGWELYGLLVFERGLDALAVEQAVLRTWRRAGYEPASPPEEMPQAGFTETVSMDDVSPTDALALAVKVATLRPGLISAPDVDVSHLEMTAEDVDRILLLSAVRGPKGQWSDSSLEAIDELLMTTGDEVWARRWWQRGRAALGGRKPQTAWQDDPDLVLEVAFQCVEERQRRKQRRRET